MPRSFSLFSRKKPTRPFKDYYTDWFDTLKNTLLPLLHQSLSASSPTMLSSRVDLLLQHFLSYYDSLDLAASIDTIPYLLFPSWRNSIEIPFLFLGDLHPYLFTNLLRSLLDRENNEEDIKKDEFLHLGLDQIGESRELFDKSPLIHLDLDQIGEGCELLDKPWQIVLAWKNPSTNLMARVEQIECGLRLMVPALVGRIRKVQAKFVGRVAEDWVACEGKKLAVDEAVKEEMEELVSVFMDANRLRRSVIMEIVGATSIYQAALFLEGLAQFLVGFRDPILLSEFERCKMPNSRGLNFGF